MAESRPLDTRPDCANLQLVASRWLMSVHAAWDLKLENSQSDSTGLRFVFRDNLSAQHTVVMGPNGDVVSYIGPFSGRPRPDARLPVPLGTDSPTLHSEVLRPMTDVAGVGERPGIPEPVSIPTPPERAGARPAPAGLPASPDAKVLGWIRDSIGIVNVSVKQKGMKDQMVHYLIEDQSGGRYHVIAQYDGTVRRFEPFSTPDKGAARPAAAASPERVEPPRAPSPPPLHDRPGAGPPPEPDRLIAMARQWLSENIGLSDVQLKESVREKNRLRLDFTDRGRNVFRIYVTDSGKVEEFKPL